MKTSIFDLFKIGIGPSSSHTVGPMRAARQFAVGLAESSQLDQISRVLAELFGSLALTGIGHGTDKAVILGLSGEKPEEVNPDAVEEILESIRSTRILELFSEKPIEFEAARDLLFHAEECLPGHPNGMRFSAFDHASDLLRSEVYYSIGGGFIVREGEAAGDAPPLEVPYPFSNGAELLAQAEAHIENRHAA